MATLTNTRIKNTYDGLLKTTDNDALGGTYKLITDGLGNSSNIYLGTGGNLGIGIIPTEKFHVNGDAIVSGDLHVDAIKPIASSNPIKFKNFASTELVRITDSGNVGIGETDPSKPLTINKNQSETAILVQSSDTGLSGIYLGGQSDSIKGGLILDNSDNSLQLRGYNNANRLHIDSSGRVGIGTSSPSLFFNQARNLVVGGSGNIGATIYSSNSGNTFLAFADVADGANSGFNAGGSIYYEHANDAMAIRVNGSERMRIDSSGNVGIGETSPHSFGSGQSGLTISDGVGGCIRLKNDAGTANFDIENGGGGGTNLNSVNAFPLRFSTNNTERMRIDSSGNVGIGTSNPGTFKLDVAGSARSNFFALRLNQSLPSESSAIYRPATGTFAIVTSAAERMRIDANGKVGIGTNQPQTLLQLSNNNSSTNTEQGAISFAGDTASRYSQISGFRFNNSNQAGLDFKVYNGALNNAMRIKNDGNVGIGDSNPGAKLVVAQPQIISGGFSTPFIELKSTAQTNTTGLVAMSFSTSTADNYGYSIGALRGSSGGASSFVISHHDNSLAGTERMRIDSSGNVLINRTGTSGLGKLNVEGGADFTGGNVLLCRDTGAVGIGTSSPSSLLEVFDSNGIGLRFGDVASTPSSQTAGYIGMSTSAYSGNNGDLVLIPRTSSASNILLMEGNVGIGTSSPSGGKLHIYATNTPVKFESSGLTLYNTYTNSNGNFGFVGSGNGVASGGNANDFGIQSVNNFVFATGGSTERMRIDSSGNVGIGTTSPDVNFQVGDGTTDAISRFYFNDNTYTQINGYGLYMSRNSSYIRPTTDNTKILYIGANTKQWNVLSMDASATLFNTNGSENMRITNTGAVGIGTTNPSANLHVYGNGQGATIRSLQTIGLEVQGGGNGTDIAIFKNTSGTEKFSLNTSGQMFNLGMASSSSANASLMHNSSTGLIYRYTSSIRYKEDVKDLTNAVDKIMKLRPVEFKPKDSLKYTTGMIAEEVFEVMPEITFKAEIEGFDEPQVDGISYEPMHAYYIKAIQEQQEMINELKSDIETLKSQINS